jgi:hypothetical protein
MGHWALQMDCRSACKRLKDWSGGRGITLATCLHWGLIKTGNAQSHTHSSIPFTFPGRWVHLRLEAKDLQKLPHGGRSKSLLGAVAPETSAACLCCGA